jgi:chloramphenicol 3-O phosphotransferase
MDKGHIIFLNGTSSSGKTTIAKALQENLSEPYMRLLVDDFIDMYPQWLWGPKGGKEAYLRILPAIISGLYGCVAALASSGNNIVLDHVLQEKEWLKECVEKWVGLEVLFVGVKCPLEIAEQREKERGDRNIGTARYQIERVHIHELYDLEVDTSVLTVEQCVSKIVEKVNKKPKMTAFEKIEN